MNRHQFYLTPKQKSTIKRGGAIQIKPEQMHSQTPKYKHPVELDLNNDGMKKLNKSMRTYKGFRLDDSHINDIHEGQKPPPKPMNPNDMRMDDIYDGGDLFGIGKAFKKSVKSTGKTLNKATKSAGKAISKTATKSYKSVNKWALKNDIGGMVEDIKAGIGEENTQLIIQGALMSTGIPPEQAGIMAGSATGAVYSVDFGKKLKGQGKSALTGALKGGANEFAKQNDIDINFDTTPSDGKPFDVKKSLTEKLIESGNNYAANKQGGSFVGAGLFDNKKLMNSVNKAKKQIQMGGSFRGSGLFNNTKMMNSVNKAKRQIEKHGGSFRDY